MIEYYDSAFKPSRFLLWMIGMRPLHHIKPIIYFFIAFSVLINALTIISLLYDETFMDFVDIIVTEIINFNVVIRVATLMYREKEFQNIFQDMEQLWPITTPDLHTVLKYLKYFQIEMIAQTLGCALAIIVHAFFTGERILHLHRPEMVPEALFAILIVDGYYIFMCCIWVGFDMLFLTLTIILMVQYKILNRSLPRSIAGDEQQECSLRNCIKQSNLLKRITDNINRILGPMLVIYIWLIIILLGMLMYMVYERNSNVMDSLKYFIILIAIIISILVYYFVPSQFLTNEINQMFDAIYCTNWYDCGLPIKKSLVMILTQKKTDAVIAAYGKLVEINFKLCTSMFRTVFSVFTFLVHMKTYKSTDGE